MPKLPDRAAAPRREADVTSDVRSTLASMRDVIHWRNNVGSLETADGRYVTYGLAVGSSDLVAVVPTRLPCPFCNATLPPIGRFVGIEVKGPRTPISADQRQWAGLVNAAHGVAGFVHSPGDAVSLVQQARLQW